MTLIYLFFQAICYLIPIFLNQTFQLLHLYLYHQTRRNTRKYWWLWGFIPLILHQQIFPNDICCFNKHCWCPQSLLFSNHPIYIFTFKKYRIKRNQTSGYTGPCALLLFTRKSKPFWLFCEPPFINWLGNLLWHSKQVIQQVSLTMKISP